MSAQYQYINLENINAIADGERDIVEEIINNYLRIYPTYLNEIDEALASGDHEKIFFCAHKLKGSFSFVGSSRLADLAEKVESISMHKGDLDTVLPLVAEMKQLAEKAKTELDLALAALE